MTTPTCGNCKFWKRNPLDYADPAERDYGQCANDKVTDTFMAQDGADTISHFSEYAPGLSFGKDFGCIHFSAKIETPSITLWAKRPYA